MRFPDLRGAVAGLLLGLVAAAPALADAADRARMAALAGSERLRLRAFGQALAAGQAPAAPLGREMVRQGWYVTGAPSLVAAGGWVAPVLSWDGNINGGLLRDSFWANGLLFEADPAWRAQAGVVAGLAAGGSARLAWAEGRLIELRGRTELAWSPEHRIGRADAALAVCSLNHMAGWTFLDLCAGATRSWRDLGNTSGRQASLTLSQVVAAPGSLHDLGLRYTRTGEGQDHVTLSAESVWNRLATGLSLTLGRPVADTTVLRRRIDAHLGWFAAGRVWRADLWHQTADGGRFLGTPRRDRAGGLGLSVQLRPGTTLRLGYARSRSTAGFADYDQITVDLRFEGWRW